MSNLDQLLAPTPAPFLITTGIYFFIIAAIGYVAARQTKNMKDFLVMGGKAGAIVSGIAYFATQYSMSTFMGVPAIAYNNGFAGMSITDERKQPNYEGSRLKVDYRKIDGKWLIDEMTPIF